LDLAKFLTTLAAGGKGILKPESLAEMWRPQFAKKDEKTGVGLGFFINERDGRRRIGHNGAIYGFATQLAYLPQAETGVVVAISCDCANPVGGRIADFAVDTLLAARDGKPLPELVTPTAVDETWLKRMDGRWKDEKTQREVKIDALGGRLWLWPLRGGFRVELKQVGDERIADDRLGFGTRIKWVDGHPVANDNRWIKQDDIAPPDIPERWKGLIGEYGKDHNILKILEWNGRLVALIEWFFIYPLKEVSENVFE